MRRLYFDYNASTPVAPEVAQVARRLLDEGFGNPSSRHWAGRPASEMVEQGRGQLAQLLGCSADEVVLTSGGSEANNLALKGVFFSSRRERLHIVTTRVEHPAILSPCRFLERLGARISYLPVDRWGLIDPDELKRAVTPDTALVSVMHANNEVGTIQPIQECARIARDHGVLFHTDAAQSVGKIPTRVDDLGIDLLSMAGHKFHAPKGVGALYMRSGVELEPLIHGAGHERGRRAGTESALLAAALGAAAALARDLGDMERVRALRERLWEGLRAIFRDEVVLNGHPEQRLPNTLNVSFVGRAAQDLLGRLENVAASTGSACHAERVELSPVLEAMGVPPEIGMGAIRLSLGRYTTQDEVDELCRRFERIQSRERS